MKRYGKITSKLKNTMIALALLSTVAMLLRYALPINACAQLGDLGEPRSSYDLGSAGILSGRNVIVSFYVDTPEGCWTTKEINATLKDMKIATEYLTKGASKYGTDATMIYDWSLGEKYGQLYHRAILPFLTEESEESDDKLNEYIAKWVSWLPSYDALLKEFDAENIFMMVFLYQDGRDYALAYDGEDSVNEALVLYLDENPGIMAHEILHLFGAHDYYKDAEYTEDVVSYIKQRYPKEIMINPSYSDGKITSEISLLTAYHLGWSPKPDEVKKYPQLCR